MYVCYILQSIVTGMFYVGSTENVQARILLHNAGNVRSTRVGKPWKIVYKEEFNTLREARKRELQIKKWKSRLAIQRLINP